MTKVIKKSHYFIAPALFLLILSPAIFHSCEPPDEEPDATADVVEDNGTPDVDNDVPAADVPTNPDVPTSPDVISPDVPTNPDVIVNPDIPTTPDVPTNPDVTTNPDVVDPDILTDRVIIVH